MNVNTACIKCRKRFQPTTTQETEEDKRPLASRVCNDTPYCVDCFKLLAAGHQSEKVWFDCGICKKKFAFHRTNFWINNILCVLLTTDWNGQVPEELAQNPASVSEETTMEPVRWLFESTSPQEDTNGQSQPTSQNLNPPPANEMQAIEAASMPCVEEEGSAGRNSIVSQTDTAGSDETQPDTIESTEEGQEEAKAPPIQEPKGADLNPTTLAPSLTSLGEPPSSATNRPPVVNAAAGQESSLVPSFGVLPDESLTALDPNTILDDGLFDGDEHLAQFGPDIGLIEVEDNTLFAHGFGADAAGSLSIAEPPNSPGATSRTVGDTNKESQRNVCRRQRKVPARFREEHVSTNEQPQKSPITGQKQPPTIMSSVKGDTETKNEQPLKWSSSRQRKIPARFRAEDNCTAAADQPLKIPDTEQKQPPNVRSVEADKETNEQPQKWSSARKRKAPARFRDEHDDTATADHPQKRTSTEQMQTPTGSSADGDKETTEQPQKSSSTRQRKAPMKVRGKHVATGEHPQQNPISGQKEALTTCCAEEGGETNKQPQKWSSSRQRKTPMRFRNEEVPAQETLFSARQWKDSFEIPPQTESETRRAPRSSTHTLQNTPKQKETQGSRFFTWKDRVEQLTNYKETFGHLQITTNTEKPYGKLGLWLAAQRSLYRKNNLKKERLDFFRKIGCVDFGGSK